MPSAQNQIQIVDTHETSETLAVTRLQRVGYQINRTLLSCLLVGRLKISVDDAPLQSIRQILFLSIIHILKL